mgnify:CR=1 FL=1
MTHSSNSNDIINEARARFVVENDSKNKLTVENDAKPGEDMLTDKK